MVVRLLNFVVNILIIISLRFFISACKGWQILNADDFRDINPGDRVLMGPGPSDVPARTLQAIAAPCIGHLDPYFLEIMNETQNLLRALFQTDNELTIPVSGTGSAGMETCFVNLVEPGDEVAVCVNGVFGTRVKQRCTNPL